MRIHYFVHLTGTDTGVSGIPRVVKNLGRALASMPDVELVPVSWSAEKEAIVHTEQRLLDNLARYRGPQLRAAGEARGPVRPGAGDWLLVPEAPHLGSHDPDYPSLLIDRLIGFARSVGLRVAALCHDILPLTHPLGRERQGAFADMAADADGGDESERQRLRFAVYAHALALADLVLPVSRTSGDLLADWLLRHGHQAGLLPPIEPILLPEESLTAPRVRPDLTRPSPPQPIEFLTVGTVCAHKNQLAAMTAFQRLIDRRPDLDMRLNVVGAVAPDVALSASQLAKRSRGKIVLHGHLPDDRLEALRAASHANVFVSLAEGYGLPVAESVWGGKPCLCSNDGSIAEIAEGGGCLPVDPRDLDAIEAGFETLAANPARYDQLLRDIARRAMRSWRDYAGEVAGRLLGFAEGRLQRRIPRLLGESAAESSSASGAPVSVLVLAASDLRVPDAFGLDTERPIRRNGAIRYERDIHGAVGENVLFFGPYVPLPAGRYAFRFDGEVSGELELDFTADLGASKLARVSVTHFDGPIVFDLQEPVEKFEIVGRRTSSLERLLLRGAFVERHAARGRPPERTSAIPSAAPALTSEVQSAVPPTEEAVYGRDDDGKPLRFPRTILAAEMRVPDAYGLGAGNRLRAGAAIAFRFKDHGRFDHRNLFFGPYFQLEPGDYTIRIDGELQGPLRLRVTQKFASETFVERTIKTFRYAIPLTLTRPAEKLEIIGDRLPETQSMTLRAIEITRKGLETDETSSQSSAHASPRFGFRKRVRLGAARETAQGRGSAEV